MKSLFKKWRKMVLRSETMTGLCCWLLSVYLRFVYLSSRVTLVDKERFYGYFKKDTPGIVVAIWHERIGIMPVFPPKNNETAHLFVSDHFDGQLILKISKQFGIDGILSREKRGKNLQIEKLKKTVSLLKKGDVVGFAPDGPRGPRRRLKEGVLTVARLSGCGIGLIGMSCSRRIVFKRSWDQFILPLPFGRLYLLATEPIIIPRELSQTESVALQKDIEEKLTELNRQADRLAGVPLNDDNERG